MEISIVISVSWSVFFFFSSQQFLQMLESVQICLQLFLVGCRSLELMFMAVFSFFPTVFFKKNARISSDILVEM